jgi:predicted nucleic acid-binding protein
MQVLVSDTSVLVDLERGGLFDLTFRLPYEFVVPDLLFNRELKGYGGEDLVARGLRVAELDASEVQLAQGTRLDLPVLSLADAFAYVLAERRGWTLLTGDGALRTYSLRHGLRVHGVLWVIDEVARNDPTQTAMLLNGLETIARHPRCRLPRAELNARLAFLRGQL